MAHGLRLFISLPEEPLSVEINALVERAQADGMELPRSYLGASIIGHECDRQVQFDWWFGHCCRRG